MSLNSVKAFLRQHAADIEIVEFDVCTATVASAADTLEVPQGQIAKSLSLRLGDEVIILVVRGDARLDNRKYKQHFGVKARMLDASDVESETGHPIGGVCPFGLIRPLRVFCDVSLRDFPVVFPAGGAPNSAVSIEPNRMAALTGGRSGSMSFSDTEEDAMTDTALAKAAGAWRSIDWRGFLLLIPPPLFWAGNFIVGRAVRQEVPPFTLLFWRWTIALILLLPFAWRVMQRDRHRYWQYRWRVLGVSLVGIVAFNAFVYIGLKSTTAL